MIKGPGLRRDAALWVIHRCDMELNEIDQQHSGTTTAEGWSEEGDDSSERR
ncbi:hypothetical protein Golax_024516 [Gossypium laxum]|uniref:Uncharacterized protein n=1 Tax=Gossypium laxum TaxID=34288 RepID=A0A7J8ZCK5_9ROSI|nr:hypothetical protein [Gossypium laxum]